LWHGLCKVIRYNLLHNVVHISSFKEAKAPFTVW
jgi:hypothetical protein